MFYAVIIVMGCLEVLHFEAVSGSMFTNMHTSNKDRLIAVLTAMLSSVAIFIVTVADALPMRFPKEMNSGIYTFCIISFIFNMALLRRVLQKIEN